MDIFWPGRGAFRIEIEDRVMLIIPLLNGNPMLPGDQHAPVLEGATHILVTHGYFDHITDVPEISKQTGAPVSGMYELAQFLTGQGTVEGHAFNIGDTISLGENVTVSLVPASHSSSAGVEGVSRYMGTETGVILRGEGRTINLSGDTGIMADMDWIADFYQPDIRILSAGGYFTMGMAEAAYAAKRYFSFKTLIPCHYRTFPLLEQSAEVLVETLPDVNVIEPRLMEAITP